MFSRSLKRTNISIKLYCTISNLFNLSKSKTKKKIRQIIYNKKIIFNNEILKY